MDDAEELKALAEKLMTHPHPEGPTSIELLLRRLPAEWGAVPFPPGAELLGSALHSRRGRPVQIEAIYAAEGDPQSALNRYEAALKESGWGVFAGFGGMHGGFVPSGLAGVHQQYRYKAEGPILMVAVLEGGPNVSDLRLRLDWDMARHVPEMQRPGRPEGWERLPPLAPPAGVPLRGGGGGGGSGSWHSEATVETDLPVPDLEVHFSRQLEAAGWTGLPALQTMSRRGAHGACRVKAIGAASCSSWPPSSPPSGSSTYASPPATRAMAAVTRRE